MGSRGTQKVLVTCWSRGAELPKQRPSADLAPRPQVPAPLALGGRPGSSSASGRIPSADLDFPGCLSPMESARGLSDLKYPPLSILKARCGVPDQVGTPSLQEMEVPA